jgi:O-antigen ligase
MSSVGLYYYLSIIESLWHTQIVHKDEYKWIKTILLLLFYSSIVWFIISFCLLLIYIVIFMFLSLYDTNCEYRWIQMHWNNTSPVSLFEFCIIFLLVGFKQWKYQKNTMLFGMIYSIYLYYYLSIFYPLLHNHIVHKVECKWINTILLLLLYLSVVSFFVSFQQIKF